MDDEQFGTGAIPDRPDERDYVISFGAARFDWDRGFRLPEPPAFDQRGSDCCVACAWAYYKWQLTGKTFSKRDLFCRIALSYGAEIRAGGVELVNRGIADNKEVKDPSSPTAANMRDPSGTKQEYRDDDKVFDCKVLSDQTIDGVAIGAELYKGVVFGVVGSNEGWKDKLNPRPPMIGEKQWGHALYVFGAHRHNGSKCIIAKSSWSATNEHHIKQDYFQALNMTFNAWFLVPKKDSMNPHIKIVNLRGEVGMFVPAFNIPFLKQLGEVYNKEVKTSADGKEVLNIDINIT